MIAGCFLLFYTAKISAKHALRCKLTLALIDWKPYLLILARPVAWIAMIQRHDALLSGWFQSSMFH